MKNIAKLYEGLGLIEFDTDQIEKAYKAHPYVKDLVKDEKVEKYAIEVLSFYTYLKPEFIKKHIKDIRKL